MKKLLSILFILSFIISIANAQESKIKLYNPEADANLELKNAIARAKAENKHVFLQIGGNWCPWCIKFHKFCKADSEIDSAFKADFIVLKINYSKENKNLDILKMLEFPQRFGFPVFVILDSEGTRLHTQNSGILEKDKNYDRRKILNFIKNWNNAALDPINY